MMENLLLIYECVLCHIYFDNYSKAVIHRGTKHFKQESLLKNKRQTSSNSEDLIKPVDLPKLTIHLEQLHPNQILKINKDLKSPAQEAELRKTTTVVPEKKSRYRTKKSPLIRDGRQEIKLDTLKAGEIETLIKDLFQASTSQQSNGSGDSGPTIRKSSRTIKERFKRNYGELDLDDLEIIRTGEARKSDTDDEDDSDSDFSIHSDSSGFEDAELKISSKNGNFRKKNSQTTIKKNGFSKPIVRKVKVRNTDGTWEIKEITLNRGKDSPNDLTVKGTYRCRICDTSFPMPKEYLDHMKSEHLKDGQYPCTICHKSFPTMKLFNRDMDKHHDPNSRWNQHIKPKHPKPIIKCDLCGKEFKYLVHLGPHKKACEKARAENPNKPFVCAVCHHRFAKRYQLRRHFVKHLENNPFKCKFPGCERTFTGDDRLRTHVERHTNPEIFKCESCPATYASKPPLDKHVSKFHSDSNPNCSSKLVPVYRKKKRSVKSVQELTEERAISRSNIESSGREDNNGRFELESIHLADRIIVKNDGQEVVHMKGEELSPQKSPLSLRSASPDPADQDEIPVPESEPPLNIFDIIASDPVVRRLHQNNPENDSFELHSVMGSMYKYQYRKNIFKCSICDWVFSRSYMYQQHMRIVHNEIQDSMSSSMELTEDNPPFAINLTCGSCGFQSKSSDDLTTHMANVHDGAKKFHCTFCGIRFPTESRKTLHENKVHLTDKKYCCDKCDAKFTEKVILNSHMNKKHNPKYKKKTYDFSCKECKGRGFTTEASYKIHMARHKTDIEEGLYTCKICNQGCANAYSLRRHIRGVHMGIKNHVSKYKGNKSNKTLQAESETRATSDCIPMNDGNSENAAKSLVDTAGSQLNISENTQDYGRNQNSTTAAGVSRAPKKSVKNDSVESSEILGF